MKKQLNAAYFPASMPSHVDDSLMRMRSLEIPAASYNAISSRAFFTCASLSKLNLKHWKNNKLFLRKINSDLTHAFFIQEYRLTFPFSFKQVVLLQNYKNQFLVAIFYLYEPRINFSWNATWDNFENLCPE